MPDPDASDRRRVARSDVEEICQRFLPPGVRPMTTGNGPGFVTLRSVCCCLPRSVGIAGKESGARDELPCARMAGLRAASAPDRALAYARREVLASEGKDR